MKKKLLHNIKGTGPGGRSKDAWDVAFDIKKVPAPGP